MPVNFNHVHVGKYKDQDINLIPDIQCKWRRRYFLSDLVKSCPPLSPPPPAVHSVMDDFDVGDDATTMRISFLAQTFLARGPEIIDEASERMGFMPAHDAAAVAAMS